MVQDGSLPVILYFYMHSTASRSGKNKGLQLVAGGLYTESLLAHIDNISFLLWKFLES